MALPMLVNNAECGPSNPLQGLSKRFDQDRGLQQDHFGASRAGSSRETFRSQQATPSGASQEAARFFSAGPAPQLAGGGAFDLSALHGSLPPAQAFRPQQQHQAPVAGAWASDFLVQQPVGLQQGSSKMQMEGQMQREMNSASAVVSAAQQQGGQQWNPMFNSSFAQRPMQNYMSPMMMQQPQQQQRLPNQHDQIMWDREFSSQEILLAAHPMAQAQAAQETPQIHDAQEGDELARTAGLLLETVRDAQAQNPKFQKSEFLGLMRSLRDRDVVVEGNEMVQNTGQAAGWASDFQSGDVKGKGRAVDGLGAPQKTVSFEERAEMLAQAVSAKMAEDPPLSFSAMTARIIAQAQQQNPQEERMQQEEDPNDAYFRQENAEYQHYWTQANAPPQASTSQLQQNTEWDHLQADWDNFEATNTGIHPVDRYIFQQNNPYFTDKPSFTTRHHLAHSHQGRQAFLDSVLELEAVVQRNMTDASAWFDLGVKQQANEREKQALQALARAVELDPSYLPAWLALAISHTNDGNRQGTHDAIRNWVDRNERYQSAVARHRAGHPEREGMPIGERFGNLIQCLIGMARSESGSEGEVDADIQIALAVLLNTNEEYEKAQDCFRTALAVRPDDFLLYNRVGATMANSGRAEEALQYYLRALELNPVYIRARFNLGISCINLRRFDEAAHHILDALGLQESDGVTYGGNDAANHSDGVTTTALWDSLRTASMHLQRPDLAAFCDRHDLEGYRRSFQV
ncbi:hypothetical protein C8F04DRAFT_1066000 [Mycena alexandri]|uniref:TPR-like protein n=1 Tax=Mycena alexandri TaxID=1745969 RepID=A0AAD6XAZ1_9AGAR|nr:hypothetical protein C8F04DRAFT_1066000 [Mycena alexandri]